MLLLFRVVIALFFSVRNDALYMIVIALLSMADMLSFMAGMMLFVYGGVGSVIYVSNDAKYV
jgi:hypothetical protein